MNAIRSIAFHPGSREELLPGFAPDFPYIATRAELDQYAGHFVPWHWHKAVELFYMESGAVEYETPNGRRSFPAGSGGLLNSNVLHMTRVRPGSESNLQLLHIFDAELLAGGPESRIGRKYILPVVTASQLELIPLFSDDPAQAAILQRIRDAFRLSETGFGYEIRLREALSEIWLLLFEQCREALSGGGGSASGSDRVKRMLLYIQEHYAEKIAVSELAAAAFLSERECFRVFRDCLHTTPAEYIRSYRVQQACRMLARGREPVTEISHACGLGSSSYFGKVFREITGCTPSEYRRRWQDTDR